MKQLCIAAATIATISPVLAQADTPSSDGLQEIVVTAERRVESLQDVPISISAFDAKELQQADITSAKDYLQLTPNVSYAQDGQTGNGSIRISIRGVSNISLGERAVPNSIGYYVDEFSVGTIAAGTINPNMIDVQRVEVLRGPQGTYFGRNATGGAINITTNLPDDKWFAEVSGYGGNYASSGGYLIVNTPLSDTFFLRGVIAYDSSDGIVKNANPLGTPNSGYDTTNARLAARWLINDKFTADFSFSYEHDREGIDADVNTGVLEMDTESIEPGLRPIDDGLGFWKANKEWVNHNTPEWNRNSLHGENLRLTYDFGNMVLKSITGNIDTHNSRSFDEDAVSVNTITRRNEWTADSWGEELRLQNKTGTQLDWVVGAIYAHDKVQQWSLVALGDQYTYTYPDTGETVTLLPPVPPFLPVNEATNTYTDKSTGVYAEATWHATQQWAFTLGGRYTHDAIDDSSLGIVTFGTDHGNLYGNSSYNDFSPRFNATYRLTPDQMLYGTVSKGYKSGGNDLNINLPEQNRPFDPETVWNYEVGYKSEWWDHKALLNLSAFYMDWHNVQSEVIYLAIPGDISSAVTVTENAASATSKGAELEFQVRPIKPLTLGVAAGYLDAKFGSFPNAVIYSTPVDLSGKPLPQSPKWTGSATAEWAQNIGNSGNNWYLRWDEVYRSSSYSNLEGVAAQPLGLGEYPFLMPSFWVANIHAGFNFGPKLTLEGGVDNLFSRDYYTGTGDHFGFAGVRITPNPQMWRLQATYRMP